MGKALNLKGQTFGYLRVISKDSQRSSSGCIVWLCKCVCGKDHLVVSESLSSGNTTSCGCKRGRQIDHNRQHRICSSCKEDLSLDKYSKNKKNCDGHEYICKTCKAKQIRSMKTNNPNWYKDKYYSDIEF